MHFLDLRELLEESRSLTPPQLDRYIDMRQSGESRNMALVLASQKFPATRTDQNFNRGRVNGNQFESCPGRGDMLRAQAEAAGVSTTGKYYCSGLAEFWGDPEAWVSDRSDVLRVCREKNLTCHGVVEHEGHEVEPMGDVTVAEDILQNEIDMEVEVDPSCNVNDLRESLMAIRSGAVDLDVPRVQDPVEHYF